MIEIDIERPVRPKERVNPVDKFIEKCFWKKIKHKKLPSVTGFIYDPIKKTSDKFSCSTSLEEPPS